MGGLSEREANTHSENSIILGVLQLGPLGNRDRKAGSLCMGHNCLPWRAPGPRDAPAEHGKSARESQEGSAGATGSKSAELAPFCATSYPAACWRDDTGRTAQYLKSVL
ncbi:hypothetical protein AAL_04316 [Moelleriella libera RCEF 2490]|uniref:Uncharacterized protein n=1 Tax=Moelleriella libera RCEF 2490 TaxID=1081109 RepID=A0A166PD79_9HYPO|nr:hypothetical protein AAL_04316 [Moelleriella libera RCEF 2490]